MISVSVDFSDGSTFTVSAESPVAVVGLRDFPEEVKVRETLLMLVEALCSCMQVSADFRGPMRHPGMASELQMVRTPSPVEEAENEVRFQMALARAPHDSAGGRALSVLGGFIADNASFNDAWNRLSPAQRRDAERELLRINQDMHSDQP
jgi:hypothetical protein